MASIISFSAAPPQTTMTPSTALSPMMSNVLADRQKNASRESRSDHPQSDQEKRERERERRTTDRKTGSHARTHLKEGTLK